MISRVIGYLSLLALAVPLSAQTGGFKVIQAPGSETDSSAGLLANGTLYVSGQGSAAPDFTGQAAESMHKVQAVLRAAGMDFENVVWMNVYLTDAHDQATLEDVYWKMIGSSPPARTVLTVAALPHGEKVEINCIAVADAGERKAIWPAGWPRGPHLDPPASRGRRISICPRKAGKTRSPENRSPDFSAETRQALENVSTILNAAQMSMKNVLWVNPYMSAGGQYDVMGKVYATYFEFGNTPGRGTIQS